MEIKKKYFSIEDIKKKLEKYCIYQDRCNKEVISKIKEYTKNYEIQNIILNHLFNENFLNEERFAKSFVRGKINIKKWGKLKIINELKIKDISIYNINLAIEEIDNKNYLKNLEHLYKKKYRELTGNDFEKKIKIKNYLFSKGYEINLINDIINN